ncbi:type VI secretion system tip protein VgrG [Erwiniaceae bacterium BAC15a-03b]|uniref:Type VI secretion system tip protein VgrG n=1 Tax=Winslowiella arboricola TaxID=2978220 RepID=A0A9J6PPK5_9GAMM|nr:type VI secretion system tip protein TssI/VgrG [Winslowiella arboricola]MCU5771708.1 type VI secretion system tip protein VgrG [Winslowiella arboricola]MCU5777621.1 type VI secretion system tip protein VgrG [Winslowiella arboricola]
MFDRITVTTPAGDGALMFWKLSGMEVVSRSFALDVSLLSTDARLDRKAMLGQPITVTIPTQGVTAAPRYLNGKITSVNVQSTELNGTRYAVYTLHMESDLWPMLRDRNQRIFQNQRVPDIIKTVLSEYGVHVEDKLTGEYRSWEYCVQYQENSYSFISRLMELEGIYFFFNHEADKHTLVLMDSAGAHQPYSGYEVIPYHVSESGGSTSEEGIGQWAISERVTPGIYSIDDYDFRKPNAWLFQARQNPASPSPGQIDYYEWPGRFVDHSHGEFYARIRQEEWQAEHQRIDAVGTALGIVPGHTFTLGQPPYASDSGDYLVVSAAYTLEENTYASGSGGGSVHKINFVVIPADITFRSAQRTEWPRTHGPQTARVVGPEGESIWTDRYGRVKVKFHWDRHAKGDDTSSCWVRVSSAWAGQGFGGMQIPRVGDEVVIDFINGDPDRPIITGRVYNEASMPPWALPAAATQMGFMTRSKDGHIDNSSHLYFEDKPGSEMIAMHSEKDMKISVENDKTVDIDGNRTTTIGKEQKHDVTGDGTFYYRAKRTTTVDQEETKLFNNSEKTKITNGRELEIVSGGDKSDITGDQEIALKGNRISSTTGNETVHVEGSRDETIDKGHKLTISTGGQNQTITGDVAVKVDGEWSQNTTGQITIQSPQQITIKSGTKVFIDSPIFERNDVEKTSFAQDVKDIMNKYISITVGSVALKAVSVAATGADISYKRVTFGRTVVNATRVEGARVDSGSLRTALFALYMVS